LRDSEESTISIAPEPSVTKSASQRELSPAAASCEAWFKRLARALKVCRLYRDDNVLVIQARDQTLDALQRLVAENNGWTLYFTPTEAYLDDEPVIRPIVRGRGEEAQPSSGEEQLPFIFFEDGVRAIRIPPVVEREELVALFDAVRVVGGGGLSQDDLGTLLWQANLRQIQVESVPLEQQIFISSRQISAADDDAVGAEDPGEPIDPNAPQGTEKRYGWTPSGTQIHAEIGQAAGTHGLHRDTFDDWELPEGTCDVTQAYQELLPTMLYSLSHFRAAWEEESARDWKQDAPTLFREMLRLDDGEESRRSIAHALVTWIGEALRRFAIAEAQGALELLREVDPDRSLAEAELTAVSAELDHQGFVDFLDQSEPEEHARYAALAVALGRPALDLSFAIMSKAVEPRVRAAACTALTYLCADEPKLLAPYFADAHGEVMIQLVFTLGQIGGPDVLDLLRLAAQHPEPRVRKSVVLALGGVPSTIRMPTLLSSLDSNDPQLIVATLQILGRERNPKVAGAILRRLGKPGFDSLPEDTQWAVFNTLADMADDECVAGLEEILFRGGLFASRSFARSAAARSLQRIGSDRARKALSRGARSFSPTIRAACKDVMKEGL
jgi:hypothetical protein